MTPEERLQRVEQRLEKYAEKADNLTYQGEKIRDLSGAALIGVIVECYNRLKEDAAKPEQFHKEHMNVPWTKSSDDRNAEPGDLDAMKGLG